MAERLTDKQVADLVTILRSDAMLDNKVQAVTNVKSAIKQHNVPEVCIPQLFEGLRNASTGQHAALVNAGFTALGHLLTRLSRQEPKYIAKEAVRTLPVIIDKLGDQKDKYRTLAAQALTTIYAVNPSEVERMLRSTAMSGKNPRAKEASLQWLLHMHQDHGLQFRSYVPLLMELLEDADGMVRDATKHTVIELFRNAPNTAKSDLKRQLKNYKVRPAIEQAIVKELAPNGSRSATPSLPAAPINRSHLVNSLSSTSIDRPATPTVPESQTDPVEPQYVNTNRELDDIFKSMAWDYEGRETEQNWQKREQGMTTLRRLNAGNAPSEFHDTFVSCLRTMLDGIIKSLTSLRTSLSKEACALIEDIALSLGPSMEPMVELLMQSLLKMTAATKKITSQMASSTIDTIISRIAYTPRLMQHIWGAAQDKNVQPRLYTTGWLKTLLKKVAHNKHHIEHTGGVDLIEKCLRKGLADANPGVREKNRAAYWAFWAVWPARADAIMEDLDATAQKLLNKDPNNPNTPKKTEPARTSSLSRTGKSASKSNLREAVLAQKKAMAAQKLPPRPGSAMAQLSPSRKVSSSSVRSTQSAHPAPISKPMVRTRPESTISVNAGGLSVAPMRPSRKRPEVSRPATAGPYSVRDQNGSMEVNSPESLRSRGQTPIVRDVTPKKQTSRTRPGHYIHPSDSGPLSPTARTAVRQSLLISPRTAPAKPRMPEDGLLSPTARFTSSKPSPAKQHSPIEAHEDFSPVTPCTPTLDSAPAVGAADDDVVASVETPVSPASSLVKVARPEQSEAADSLRVYEDPDTEMQQSILKPEVPVPPVLEDRPVNEDAAKLQKPAELTANSEPESAEKMRQNSRLLDSGIAKIKAMSLEVHGFRKLQSLIRDSKTTIVDDKFEALVLGLFRYLENPLSNLPADKAQDIKVQILGTIKLLLKKDREGFQPHVSEGLEALLQTRSRYDSRAHVVSGLELLADELVGLGDEGDMVTVLTQTLGAITDQTTEGCRSLSMGLHVLKEMLDKRVAYVPDATHMKALTDLARQSLGSADLGVRMDAVKLCVAMHARVGDGRFWDALTDVEGDAKSLVTYYIVKREREGEQV